MRTCRWLGLDKEDECISARTIRHRTNSGVSSKLDRSTLVSLSPWLGSALRKLDLEDDRTPLPDSGISVSFDETYHGVRRG